MTARMGTFRLHAGKESQHGSRECPDGRSRDGSLSQAGVAYATVLLSSEPDCAYAYSTMSGVSSAADTACQDECSSVLAGACRDSTNKWLCVAQALPACAVPNADRVTCHVETSVGPYDAQSRTCSCPESSPACTAEEAEATRFDWESTFKTLGNTEGVVVAKARRALWTTDSSRWRYENGFTQMGGCGANPWIVGVFCKGRLAEQFTEDTSGR